MKASEILFWSLAGYFFVIGNLYAGWGLLQKGYIDWSGGTPLGLCAVLAALIAFFLNRTRKSQGGVLPEDRGDATIDEGDAELGQFSPWSWWPLVLAASAFLVFLGFAVGIWIAFIGAPLAVIGIVGWQFEYYRGYFAR
jgi:ribose/xylose/arabinose/galactoside ABC-type transport system permease subunit